MSLILEALKKSESDRKYGSDVSVEIGAGNPASDRPRKWLRAIIPALFVIGVASIGGVYLIYKDAAPLIAEPAAVGAKETEVVEAKMAPAESPAAEVPPSNASPVIKAQTEVGIDKPLALKIPAAEPEPLSIKPVEVIEIEVSTVIEPEPKPEPEAKPLVAAVEAAPEPITREDADKEEVATLAEPEPVVAAVEKTSEPIKPVEVAEKEAPTVVEPEPVVGVVEVTPEPKPEPVMPVEIAKEVEVTKEAKEEVVVRVKPEPKLESVIAADQLNPDPKPQPAKPVEKTKEDVATKIEPEPKPEAKAQLASILPPQKPLPATPAVRKTSSEPDRDPISRAAAFEQQGQWSAAIEAYSVAILKTPNMTEAYVARGWAHEANRAYEAAAEDFSKAIALNPDSSDFYYARGWALEQSRQYKSAIKDYSQAIMRAPQDYQSYFSRGFLLFYQDDLSAAVDDFLVVYNNANSVLADYALLWMYLARTKVGLSADQISGFFASKSSRSDWPGIIFSAFMGGVTPDKVLVAMQSQDGRTQRKRECVGYFFLGLYRLLNGDREGAKAYFKKTLATGITSYRQYEAARLELQKLALN